MPLSSTVQLTADIKTEALRLGFFACGMARAGHVSSEAEARLRRWISQGGHADMHYMQNNMDLRLDPRLLMPGTRSIICVALNYAAAHRPPANEYQLATYALGQDYHDVVKQKLHQLAAFIQSRLSAPAAAAFSYRACCDSAPLWERYWAEQAGLGWTGRNHQLIIPPMTDPQTGKTAPGGGTMFFLGELLVNVDLAYDAPMPNRCGTCHRCIDACPTGALTLQTSNLKPQTSNLKPQISNLKPQASNFNATACLSYQTIEHRGPIATPYAKAMGDTIYGCDRCQQACPWNRFATPTTEPQLQPRPELLAMTKADWHRLTVEDYRRLFKGNAVKRAKYEGLMRNIQAAAENQPPSPDQDELSELS